MILRVRLAVGGQLLEFWSVSTLHSKPFVIGEMEMERVEFHCCHAIDVALDNFKGHEVSRNVNHQSAPGKPRAIFHAHSRNDPAAALVFLDQLKQSLDSAQNAEGGGSRQLNLVFTNYQAVTFILAERLQFLAGRIAANDQKRRGAL